MVTRTKTQRAFLAFWKRFFGLVVKLFYRLFEASNAEFLHEDEGTIPCATHVNALADPAIVQASTPVRIRPTARSGLFSHALLHPVVE